MFAGKTSYLVLNQEITAEKSTWLVSRQKSTHTQALQLSPLPGKTKRGKKRQQTGVTRTVKGDRTGRETFTLGSKVHRYGTLFISFNYVLRRSLKEPQRVAFFPSSDSWQRAPL